MKKKILFNAFVFLFISHFFTNKVDAQEHLIQITPPCSPITSIPFSENFNSLVPGTATFPTCWKKIIIGTGISYISSSTSSGSNSLVMSTSSSNYSVMPRLDPSIDIRLLQMNFKMKANYLTDSLQVGIMTDSSDINTFSLISTFTVSSPDTFISMEALFGSYTGNGSFIVFKIYSTSTYYHILIDDIVVEYMPSCPKPSNLSFSNVTSTTADFQWSENGTSTSWNIEYCAIGDSIATQLIGITSHPITISNLNPYTSYQFKVKSNCGTDSSMWSIPRTILTACEAISTLPWSDQFNSYGTSDFPTCWYRNSNVNNYPIISEALTYGNGYLYFHAYIVGTYNIAATPILSSQIPVQSAQISFNYKSGNLTDTLYVGVMTDPANASTFQEVAIITNTNTQLWHEKRVLFNHYLGTGRFIAFKVKNTGIDVKGCIDNFVMDYAPSCLYPLNLNISNITTTSVNLSWTEAGNASTWNIRYAPVGATPGNETVINSVSSNSYQISGLNSQSMYRFYVQSNCGLSTSPWSLPVETVTSCSVISQFPYIETFDFYNSVEIDYPTCWSSIDNGDNPPSLSTANVSPPTSLSFSCLSPGKYNYAIAPPIADSISINTLRVEFNMKNLQLDDTLYLGVMSSSTDTSTFVLVKKFSVPFINQFKDCGVDLDSYSGSGRFIALKTFFNNTYPLICIDDFKIFHIPECAKPTGLEVLAVTDSVAQLYWSDEISVPYWKIEYGPAGFVLGTGIQLDSVMNSPLTISGLNPETTYQFYVYANCGSGSISVPSIPYTFTTACNPITTIPYYENFDTYGIGLGIFPTCWRLISQELLSTQLYLNSVNNTPPASMYIRVDDIYASEYIITPMIDNSILLNTLKLDFNMKAMDVDDTVFIGIMNSSTDPNSFELIKKIPPGNVGSWENQEVFFNSYIGSGTMVAFKFVYSPNSTTVYIDNVRIDTMPHCPRPSNLTASAVQSSSFYLEFIENGTASNWVVEYGPVGFLPGTGVGTVLSNINSNYILISGLIFNTTYHFYVKSICGVGEESLWSNPLTVRTTCYQINTLPWSDTFNTYGVGSTIFPACWSKKSNVNNNPYISTGYYNNIGVLTFTCNYSGKYSIASTPEFDSSIPINTIQANFQVKVQGIDDTLYVGVMTDPTNETTFECIQKILLPNFIDWFDQEISFSNYTGTGHYIAFKTRYGTTSSSISIDNLTISYIPTCPIPTELEVLNILNNSVTLHWNENGPAQNWKVEYGLSGYTPGTGNITETNSNYFIINGLPDTTCYDFYVQSICSISDSSLWSEKGMFCTAQVPASIPVTFDFEIPSGFQFANNMIGNKWFIDDMFDQSVNNTPGGSKGMFISFDSSSYDYLYNFPGVVWAYRDIYFTPSTDDYLLSFDWKLNGEVDPNDYLNVYIGPSTKPIPNTTGTVIPPLGSDTLFAFLRQQTSFQTNSALLPLNQYSGQRKRIFFMWRNNNANGAQPPAAVDNITITTLGETVCEAPTNLTVSSIDFQSAILNWNPGSNESEWIVEYKKSAEGGWTSISVLNTPFLVLSSLTQSTDYLVRVKSKCDTYTYSIYSDAAQFSTFANPCVTPTGLNFTTIFNQFESIYWYPGSNEYRWAVELEKVNEPYWDTSIIVLNDTYLQLHEIVHPHTLYRARVKSLCDPGESDFSDYLQFMTGGGVIYHTVTVTSSGPGTVTPYGEIEIFEGGMINCVFTPDPNSIVTGIEVDSMILYGAYPSFYFNSIDEDHSIHVFFGTIGIDEITLEQMVTLSPNPANNEIELVMDYKKLIVRECQVFDVYGKLLKTISIQSDRTVIDISDFSAGVFIVHLNCEKRVITKKFLKQ